MVRRWKRLGLAVVAALVAVFAALPSVEAAPSSTVDPLLYCTLAAGNARGVSYAFAQQAAATGTIEVANQAVANRTITVAKANISQDGWIAVHKAGPDGKLLLTPLAGMIQIKAGDSMNVVVPLVEDVAAGASLWPMLHIDAGTMGTYEFPNGPDVPVVANGAPVMQQITIQGAPAQLPTTGADNSPISPVALLVTALALLVGGALTLRRSSRRGNA